MEKFLFKVVSVSLSFLLHYTYLVEGDIFELRDIKFDSNYNKNELPPSHDGKPLLVSELLKSLDFFYNLKILPIFLDRNNGSIPLL